MPSTSTSVTPARGLLANLAALGERLRAGFRPRATQTFATAVPRVAWRVAARLSAERAAVLGDDVIDPALFGKTAGLLPVFIWHADRLAREVMKQGSGVYFEPEGASLTGYRCAFPITPAFSSSVLLFLQESLHDAWENLPRDARDRVVLDDFVGLFIGAQLHPESIIQTAPESPQP